MQRTAPKRPFRAVFSAPRWPTEYTTQVSWQTPEAAAYYALSLLEEPHIWMPERAAENRVFLNDLQRDSDGVSVRIMRDQPSS